MAHRDCIDTSWRFPTNRLPRRPRARCSASVGSESAEPVSGLAGTGAEPTLAPATRRPHAARRRIEPLGRRSRVRQAFLATLRPPMRIPLYQVDAFTSRLFGGNPAAVCPLTEWLPEATMQAIAAENNLAETAFFVRAGRWLPAALVYAYRRGRAVRSRDARFGLCGDPHSRARAALGDFRHTEGRAARSDP